MRMRIILRNLAGAAAGLALAFSAASARAQNDFVNFEIPPQHPVDISPNGATLAIANLPDGRLDLFSLASGTPDSIGSVAAGVDPVSVRFRTDSEAWVVNHISDSVSVVDLATMRVTATIQTEDEPYDVVFANGFAFVSCSQVDLVQVFNPTTHALIDTVVIDAEEPRGMAVSADGTRVYVAIFESGNSSTALMGGLDNSSVQIPNVVDNPAGPYGGQNPPPNDGAGFNPPINPLLPGSPPRVGLIVKKNGAGQWMDDNNGNWTNLVSGASAASSGRPVGWDLPDRDVAVINTTTFAVTYATGLMNICTDIAVNPATGDVTVIGMDATNEIRFEPVIRGKFTKVNLATVDAGTLAKTIVDLNGEHLDYSAGTIAQTEREKSLGDPRGIAWNAAGDRAYVTGMGSNNLIIIGANGLRAGAEIVELGEGPTGLAVDAARNQLYVWNRFENSISVVSTVSETETARIPMHDASPDAIKVGRKHLYDTHKNSGLGQIACASCHVDARMDRLAWDLGDPAGEMKAITNVASGGKHNLGMNVPGMNNGFGNFHPMKGPMTTQTFQDIIGKEPLHWRGDRDGLEEFNPAFMFLQGDDELLTMQEMQEFEDMLATVAFPPNARRNFDNTLSTSVDLTGHFSVGEHSPIGTQLPNGNAQAGLNIYIGVTPFVGSTRRLDNPFTCVICHSLPTGSGSDSLFNGTNYVPIAPGPAGERHLAMVSVDGNTQPHFKTAQLRNQFDKHGMDFTHTSNKAGFGVLHDGTVDSLSRFLSASVFSTQNDQELANLIALVLSFSGSDFPESPNNNVLFPPGPPASDAHAAVGKQATATGPGAIALFGQADVVQSMINLADRSSALSPPGRVDLVVNGVKDGINRSWVWNINTNVFDSDLDGETITQAALAALASASTPLTYTVVARGTGVRIGIDRDSDGFGNQTELDAGSDPANPLSFPGSGEIEVAGGPLDFGMRIIGTGPSSPLSVVVSNLGLSNLDFTGPGFAITSTDAAHFAISNSPSTDPLASLDMRTVEVVFEPLSPGLKQASLTITSADLDEPSVNVVLTGEGIAYSSAGDWNVYE